MRRLPNPFLLLLIATTACGVTNRPVCEVLSETEVADDEVTPYGTALELLDRVEHDARLAGRWWDGTATEVDVLVARGTGPAVVVEQQAGTEQTRHWGLGSQTLMMAVDCPHHLRVPVEAVVDSADATLHVAAAGEAWSAQPFQDPTGSDISLYLEGEFADAEFPVSETDPADYQDLYSFVNLSYGDDDTLAEGAAGWGGSRETPDASSSHAEYVVTFD